MGNDTIIQKLVFKYLNRYYRLSFDSDGVYFIDLTYDKYLLRNQLFFNEMKNILETVFCDDMGGYIKQYVIEYEKVNFKDLYLFMRDYHLVLGNSVWEIRHKQTNLILTQKSLIIRFEENYNANTIIYFYDKWYEDEITSATEKLMGFK